MVARYAAISSRPKVLYLLSGGDNFLEKKTEGSPNFLEKLLQNRSNGYARTIHHKSTGSIVYWVFESGCISESFLVSAKAAMAASVMQEANLGVWFEPASFQEAALFTGSMPVYDHNMADAIWQGTFLLASKRPNCLPR